MGTQIGAWRSLVAHLLWEQRVACSNHAAPTSRTPERVAAEFEETCMRARIFEPAKSAMQSGRAQTRRWLLEFEPEQPLEIDPLMGWTSSSDMRRQVQMAFDTAEEAIAYCKAHAIPYQLFEPHRPVHRPKSYADNFRFDRKEPWSH